MNRNRKTILLSRRVKTKQQVHREVEQKGAAFQMLAKWQADYWLLKGKQNETA